METIMVKEIRIEYCGEWGYDSAAFSLQRAIEKAIPDTEVAAEPQTEQESSILSVYVKINGEKKSIWRGNRF